MRGGVRTLVPFPRPFRQFSGFPESPRARSFGTTTALSQQIVEQQQNDPILADLNESQIQAVTQPLAAITRVVAGPGSGKTRVLTQRIAYLLREDPKTRILAVTFTRKAAGEMQSRLESLLSSMAHAPGEIPGSSSWLHDSMTDTSKGDFSAQDTPPAIRRVTLGTFHSVCAKILRWNGDYLSKLPSVRKDMAGSSVPIVFDGKFVVVDQGEQLRILKDALQEKGIDLKSLASETLRPYNILSSISKAKSAYAQGRNPFQPSKDKPLSRSMKIASQVYSYYHERLRSTNSMDFDDLILLARELLDSLPEVRNQLRRRWTHILIDEFQDTSRSQMDLVKLWTDSSLFIVGDPNQSIYNWRGAHVGSIVDFEEEFKDRLGTVDTVSLMENYRSTSNIVKAAQKIISSGDEESGKNNILNQNMKPKRGPGLSPRIVACSDEKAEADFILTAIKENLKSGKYSHSSSVALIYRTNAQSRALEEACVSYNIPYVIFGKGTSFYKRQEVKDTLSFLRWLMNGHDRAAMERALQTQAGIGPASVDQFDQFYREYLSLKRDLPNIEELNPLVALIELSTDPDSRSLAESIMKKRPFNLFLDLSSKMKEISDLAYAAPIEKVMMELVAKLDLMDHFNRLSKSNMEFEERQANVKELQRAAARYSKDGPCLGVISDSNDEGDNDAVKVASLTPLSSFLDDAALITEVADDASRTSERFVVSLMTIHASKGTEFDTVFVVGNEEGTFPTSQALELGDGSVQLEEERRLCYVAMTRAKTELLLTWRKEVSVFTSNGIKTYKRIRSRFLDVLAKSKKSKGIGKSGESRAELRSKPNRKFPYEKETNLASFSTVAGQGYRTVQKPPSLSTTPLEKKSRLPYETRLDKKSRSVMTSAYPPQRDTGRLPKQKSATPLTNNSASNADQTGGLDSTWFFPIGSKVEHRHYGRGTVKSPPPSDAMKVNVEFEDGTSKDFPLEGSHLIPVIN